MICLTVTTPKLRPPFSTPTTSKSQPRPSSLHLQSLHQDPRRRGRRPLPPSRTHLLRPLRRPIHKPLSITSPTAREEESCSSEGRRRGGGRGHVERELWAVCGVGYWLQGFRCFPWLALNFHMAHGLSLSPSTLQLVQHTGNLPMVAKPLYGVLSDAVYIGGARRLPYISIGVILQVMSWGTLALIPIMGDTFPTQMACILLSNLGGSITEVMSDALVAEFSRTQKGGELQSYAFIALAAGGILGNLSGGFVLLKTQEPRLMFSTFAFVLTIQLALSLATKENSLYSSQSSNRRLVRDSVSENLRKQFSKLITAISEERIIYPLSWAVASTAIIPILSGSMFCFQTQCLKLDPSIIGLSKVIGQLMVLSAVVLYNRYLKRIPMRTLIFRVQMLYALALLSDFFLVKQINLKFGISNEAYVLCLSAVAEAIAQFKILPFSVLFSSLCPSGSEGSLFAFFSSALCLSSILSGILGVGLASLIRLSIGDYSSLPLCIIIQFIAALIPLGWISLIPTIQNMKVLKRSKRKLRQAKAEAA